MPRTTIMQVSLQTAPESDTQDVLSAGRSLRTTLRRLAADSASFRFGHSRSLFMIWGRQTEYVLGSIPPKTHRWVAENTASCVAEIQPEEGLLLPLTLI